MQSVYIGTSGFNFPHWRKLWYPATLTQRNWMSVYSSEFNAIEINATFYKPFPKSVYESWAKRTPEEFKFAIKAPKIITHEKRMRDGEAELDAFFAAVSGLGTKLGVILWQFPSVFFRNTANEEALRSFLPQLPQSFSHAIEFRHHTWLHPAIYDVLQTHDISLVIVSSGEIPAAMTITSPLVYLRFHGPEALYSSGYTEEHLETWSQMIRSMHGQTDTIFGFFNNDKKEHGIENAQTLRDLLDVPRSEIPTYKRTSPDQLSLKF